MRELPLDQAYHLTGLIPWHILLPRWPQHPLVRSKEANWILEWDTLSHYPLDGLYILSTILKFKVTPPVFNGGTGLYLGFLSEHGGYG